MNEKKLKDINDFQKAEKNETSGIIKQLIMVGFELNIIIQLEN